MTTMRALRLNAWHQPAALEVVERPFPGEHEVLVQVGGAGACHSDLHLMRDFGPGALPWNPPFTLGHENAGWVHTVGTAVTGIAPGDPVAVVGAWGCGRCERCRAGLEPYCEDPPAAAPGGGCGLGLDGGMAEFLLVPHPRHLVPLPAGLSPVDAAPLTDAALTPYHAIRRSLPKLAPDTTAMVVGVGGLGQMAVQLLKAMTAARVVAVDPRGSARELAVSSGADLALAPGDLLVGQVRDFTGGHGADVVIDMVGSDATLAAAAACARKLGDLTIVGLAGGTLPVSFFGVPFELSVQTTYWGNRHELVEVLDLAASGMILAQVRCFHLDEALAAYDLLASGEIEGRAVLTPFTSYTP